MTEPRRWTISGCSASRMFWRRGGPDLNLGESVDVMPVVEHEELLRGPVHGLIQTIRGMCTDERPWVEIDAKLRELDDLVCGHLERVSDE